MGSVSLATIPLCPCPSPTDPFRPARESCLDSDGWKRIRPLLEQLLDLPVSERSAWLDEHISEPDLLAELERLAAADEDSSGWLRPGSGSVADLFEAPAAILESGTRLGPYRILDLIAAGGMGEVYRAEQSQPRRVVALKILRGDRVDEELLRRFRTEAEVLGHLHHPGIAQIHDAGAEIVDGVRMPYIAMEHVEHARSLVEYARAERLDEHGIAELFATVCDAVHHAHQKGVLHRDLKPGNVLVDGEGRPKVIDFGLARTDDEVSLAHSLARTRAGDILGTLAYMSPEHVSGDSFDVDVRSDVYSLGAILCELLSGRTPHDLDGLALPAAVRCIAEKDPFLPSEVGGDLRWIMAKALERDPARRYASASELGADVRRVLENEPVLAGPPSSIYRLRRFARRNRTVLFSVSAVVAALALGLVRARDEAQAAKLASKVADEARLEAERAASVATKVSFFFSDVLESAGLYRRGREARVVDALEEAEIALAKVEDPVVHAAMASLVGKGFLDLDMRDRARPYVVESAETLRELAKPENLFRLRAEVILADLLELDQRYEESLALSERLLPLLEEHLGPAHETTAYLRYNLAVCYQRLGQFEKQEQAFLVLRDQAAERDGERSIAVANAAHKIAVARYYQGRLLEALETIEEAIAMFEDLGAKASMYQATAHMDLGTILMRMGDNEAALDAYRQTEKIYASGQPLVSNRLALASNLAGVLLELEQVEEAEGYAQFAVDLAFEEWEQLGYRNASTLELLGRVALAKGDSATAESLVREALEIAEEHMPATSIHRINMRATQVRVLLAQGRLEEAVREAERYHEEAREAFDLQGLAVPAALESWARAALACDEQELALAKAERALELTNEEDSQHRVRSELVRELRAQAD